MADYDSDSSVDSSGDIRTKVLLGYASVTPTSDDFSQIGGHPKWLDPAHLPSVTLAKCKVCNKFMSLMLQLNGDLPDNFPGHERRLYVWVCRGKTCRRKDGSVRAFRGVRVAAGSSASEKKVVEEPVVEEKREEEAPKRVGEALFGVKPNNASAGGNPFGGNPFASGGGNKNANPFAATSSLAAKPAQKPTQEEQEQPSLPETFADKARISSPSTTTTPAPTPSEPWPSESSFPKPYPSAHIDAGAEYIDPTPNTAVPSNVRIDDSADGMGVKDAFESSMDKTFQKFADRLAQNPEQILRYEYAGQPLLYSKTDAIGKKFSATEGKISTTALPRCGNCGAGRVFELQLTPQLIMELEKDDMSLDGMDWGSVIVGCCEKDCYPDGGIGFVEECAFVQWEEAATHKKPT
ncbi:related to rat apoptosis protein RP-8 [Ramularia collo-cygni]|uniref:Related to rat apoptosis protein RP-8 n=1 Tax=Ramularia collo-cygni TaxID=112498 RepID=A0A2D3UMJ5_9PEZI|nr:related to rat apoptosis protein RP-8 [Ramularia collo-cygni]CZT15381.1 related to rat apoptosis protein RP-8 [Ramularia collo-cygni]